ncbi:MAG: hypothetical protein IT163_21360 [Bryobacterales bacterium]|nr:hypothetical protein [Bryobacterales bacterium]
MRMTLSLASLAKACSPPDEIKPRRPQPMAIEPVPEGMGVNFQVLLLPGFKLSTPALPALPHGAHRQS